jgi:hypothetical protein
MNPLQPCEACCAMKPDSWITNMILVLLVWCLILATWNLVQGRQLIQLKRAIVALERK